MKKLLIFFTTVFCANATNAQLQNLNFESWNRPETNDGLNSPVGWIWTNSNLEMEKSFYYPPHEDAQNGAYALHLSVWYTYTKDAAIQHAPINYKPVSLKGFYKYVDNLIMGENGLQQDTALVSVFLTKATAIGKDTVGVGLVNIGDSATVFTPFEAIINYTSNEMPDAITVILDPSMLNRSTHQHLDATGVPTVGLTSFLTIDNLSLTGGATNIATIENQKSFRVFPNPTQDNIRFASLSGQARIIDISGKVKLYKELQSEQILDVSSLQTGIYYLQILDSNKQLLVASFVKN